MPLCIVSSSGYETSSSAAAALLQDRMYPDENETVRQPLCVCVRASMCARARVAFWGVHKPVHAIKCKSATVDIPIEWKDFVVAEKNTDVHFSALFFL